MTNVRRRGWDLSGSNVARSLVALCFGCGGLIAEEQPASAAPAWSMVASANPPGPPSSGLSDVTCTTATMCLAIGVKREYIPELGAERWDGAAWHNVAVQTPASFTGDGLINLGCATSSNCFAVGSKGSPYKTPLMERWNGAKWSIIAAPKPSGAKSAWLTDVNCATAKSCVAVGNYDTASASIPYSLRWNGTRWTLVAAATKGKFSYMHLEAISCTAASSCFAVGRYQSDHKTLVERWNGTKWSIVSSPNPPGAREPWLLDVSCSNAKSCVAVGTRTQSTGYRLPIAERWDGTSWKLTPTPPSSGALESVLFDVSCASPVNCFATGYNATSSSAGSSLQHWDGARWTTVDHAGFGSFAGFSGVFCASDTACFAVGAYGANPYNDFTGSNSFALIARWDGTAWSVGETPLGGSQSELEQVSCPTPTSCLAVGSTFDQTRQAWAERWNGATWSQTPTPIPAGAVDSTLTGVSCSSSANCFAVGTLRTTADPSVISSTLVEHWDGATWSVVTGPTGLGGALNAVSCSSSNTCEAVGTLIEHWDGSAWTTAAKPTTNILRAVSCASVASCLAVGDDLISLAFDGTHWSTVPVPKPAGVQFAALYGVSCAPDGTCFTTGFISGGHSHDPSLVERWNGSKWSMVATPKLGKFSAFLQSVSCTSSTNCVAAGVRSSQLGVFTLIERWNGTSLAVEASPNPTAGQQSILKGVSCTSNTGCVAVGYALTHLFNFPLIEETL